MEEQRSYAPQAAAAPAQRSSLGSNKPPAKKLTISLKKGAVFSCLFFLGPVVLPSAAFLNLYVSHFWVPLILLMLRVLCFAAWCEDRTPKAARVFRGGHVEKTPDVGKGCAPAAARGPVL